MIRVVTNPATSRLTTMQVLPMPSAQVRAAAIVSSEVFSPRTNSHSFIIGTGEKKCVPTTASGRWVAAAIRVIGMAEVFVASDRTRGGQAVQVGEERSLEVDLLDDRLDDDVGPRCAIQVRGARDAG